MANTTSTTTPPDSRAAAGLRLTVRSELGDTLRRIVPQFITVFAEDGAVVDLLAADAREMAIDLVEELGVRGYVIVRSSGA